MNLSEALDEVVATTKRPDKRAEALRAINKAISYCTLKGSFRNDVVEATIVVDPALYGDTISLASLTRFRRFTYIKPTTQMRYLTPIADSQVFSPQNVMQTDRYYIAGTSMTYTLSTLTPTLEVGYLTYPQVLDETTHNTHWMLDMMPYAIIDLAAAKVFGSIGDDASAKYHEMQGMEQYRTLYADLCIGD